MHVRAFPLSLAMLAGFTAFWLCVPQGAAQRDIGLLEPDQAQAQLERAIEEGRRAETRAERLTREAQEATEAADKTAREAAALAARIQRSEADIAAARARFSLVQADREALSARLNARRQPLVQLVSALQTTSRRPLSLSALQPGSLKDLVYVRAVLDSAVPQIRKRTATLRSDLEEGRRLERAALRAIEELRENEQDLRERRAQLAELETRQRLASRDARNSASRENERALALAEEARDLNGLMNEIDAAAALRRELAALSGPVLRPDNLGDGQVTNGALQSEPNPSPTNPSPTNATADTSAAARPRGFQLPVQGRTLAGFGERRESGLRSTGITLAPVAGAQVVAPATGRVAFAGPYRGFGRIIIIEHPGGWTSLVTGMARTTVSVGDNLIGGSPLGVAGDEEPSITLELRREGEPVNPLIYLSQ